MRKAYNILKRTNLFHFVIFILTFSALNSSTLSCFGQTGEEQRLANTYYQDKEYDKAEVLFESFYKKTKYKSFRDKYLSCLIEQSKFEEAEKFLKKELKKNKHDFYLEIDLGMVYFSSNRIEEANKEFDKAISIASKNRNNTISAANKFISSRHFEQAEKAYIIGSKHTNTDFTLELASLYYYQRDYAQMITEYIKHLLKAPQDLESIKNRLSYMISQNFDESVEATIANSLLNATQKHPENIEINDLLIWQYTQNQKFGQALKQLIAIDKRGKTSDSEIIEFSYMLSENNELDLSIEAFNYILSKGEKGEYYHDAYVGILNVKYLKITSEPNPSLDKIIEIEKALSASLDKISRKESYLIIYNLINLKAFYLNKKDEAIELIITSINENRFDEHQELILNILLGDIYMTNNNPWDAILTYAKVENNNIDNELGEVSKFKKAKLAYYMGEFKWAQAQLDVLKSGTSRLISNDAIELSMFISENYDVDTSGSSMIMFARADLNILSKKYQEALSCLDSIIELYPTNSLIDDAIYRKAQIYEALNEYDKAIECYKEIFTRYFYDILADNSLYRYAILQEKRNNLQESQDAFLKIITDYPNSIYVIEARKKLRKQD